MVVFYRLGWFGWIGFNFVGLDGSITCLLSALEL